MMDPRYPIGPFVPTRKDEVSMAARLPGWIDAIASCPQQLRFAVQGLHPEQLATAYREGGWTLRDVAHHVPDSHMNAVLRLKLALTEDDPWIRPYFEDRVARLPDYARVPVDVSVDLLASLHARWVALLRNLAPQAFSRTFRHPESGRMTVADLVEMYAWHGRHHVAQITHARARAGW